MPATTGLLLLLLLLLLPPANYLLCLYLIHTIMKAFLNRLNRGLTNTKDKDRDQPTLQKEKIPQLSPLPEWPPPQRATSTPTSISQFKPLPDISLRPLPPIEEPQSVSPDDFFADLNTGSSTIPPQHDFPEDPPYLSPIPPSSPDAAHAPPKARPEHDSTARSSRKTTHGSVSTTLGAASDVQKKVAFISPPPTPGPQLDRALPNAPEALSAPSAPAPAAATNINNTNNGAGAPIKTTVARFHSSQAKESRGSTSTAASSKTDVASFKSPKVASASTSTRVATPSYPGKTSGDAASILQSVRSGTPYSQATNASSRILAAQSWSEVAEEDLVTHIGQRERTRQEVLWEIVASEER